MVQRLKIVEREKDGLEGARIAAEAYIEKEQECVEAQCLVYQASSTLSLYPWTIFLWALLCFEFERICSTVGYQQYYTRLCKDRIS